MSEGNCPVTVIPMLLAVPATILMADSRVNALRSDIFSLAMALTWSQVMEATFFLLGSPEAFCSLATSLRETATGDCFTTKEKVLSE